MLLFYPKETNPEETRISIVPEIAKKLVALGFEVEVESGIGNHLHFVDSAYKAACAVISQNREESFKKADVILRFNKPAQDEIPLFKKGALYVSFLDPFQELPLVQALAAAHVHAISMEMVPRSTVAQKMDALSSQANLAGYYAVILAAERLDKILPMMMTPSGTISPAKVFVIGVGVAGLQAIATAKRLGARVEAFDTRPTVKDQVKSLAAKFVEIDLGETGQTAQGYAKELTPEQIEKQRQGLAEVCAKADIVITTARLFGKKAPLIVTEAMLDRMQPGSVVVDMAVDMGGNVAGSRLGEEVDRKGVRIIGLPNLARLVPIPSSEAYATNLYHLLTHCWNKESKGLKLSMDDDILKGCLVTSGGSVVNPMIQNLIANK